MESRDNSLCPIPRENVAPKDKSYKEPQSLIEK
jgi:hypothetical protein